MQALNQSEIKAIAELLRHAMKREGISQAELSSRIRVDQSLISRVLNLKFKRLTPAIVRLQNYANMQIGITKSIPNELSSSIEKYMALGGDPSIITYIVNNLIGTSNNPQINN